MKRLSCKQLKRWFFQNLANTVTVLGLIGTFWLLVIAISSPGQLWLILILAVLIGLTDLIDGLIAKYLKIKSNFGSALDRLRDKIFICPLLIILVWHYPESLSTVSIVVSALTKVLVVVIVLLESLLLTTWLIGVIKKLDVSSNQYGQTKMFFEFFVVIFWLISLTVKKYLDFSLIHFSIYLIDLIMVVTIYLAIRSLKGYYQKYNNKDINHKPKI